MISGLTKQSRKLVPELRFGEFSEDWNVSIIQDHFEFKNGLNKGGEFFGHGNPIINFLDVYKLSSIKKADINGLVELTSSEIERYNVRKGDVFFTRTSETIIDIGMSATLVEDIENCVFSGFVLRARPKDDLFEPSFTSYCFGISPIRKEITTKSSMTTRALTSGTSLNKVIFRFPNDKKEQQKIANFLTSVDQRINLLKQKKAALETYKKGLMQKIFNQEIRFKDKNGHDFPDWEEKRLGDLCDVRDGTHDSPKYLNKGFPLITSKNLTKSGEITFDDINFISKSDFYEINKRSKVNQGDILFGMIGTIGNPVIVKETGFAIKNVALIKISKDLLNFFLVQYLKNNHIKWQFYRENAGGTQKFIALGVIRKLIINTPSFDEQKKIADCLSVMDQSINKLKNQIAQTTEFKKGLLQRMFV